MTSMYVPNVPSSGTLGMSRPLPVAALTQTTRMLTSYDFYNTFGVVVHPNTSYGGYYASATNVLARLQDIGVDHIRTNAPTASSLNNPNTTYSVLSPAGIRYCLLTTSLTPSLANVVTMIQKYPGCVAALEGPNEINNFSFTYNGVTDPTGQPTASNRTAVTAYMPDLKAAMQTYPETSTIKLVDYTDYGTPNSPSADYFNVHPYANGNWPDTKVDTNMATFQSLSTVKGAFATESGYFTGNGDGTTSTTTSANSVVSLADQAAKTLELICAFPYAGFAHQYIYELADETTDGSEGGSYGLFKQDGTAKPAAAMLMNLKALMKERVPFNPVPFNVTITGGTFKTLLVAISDGRYILFYWRPLTSNTTPATTNITVTLSGTKSFRKRNLMDGTFADYTTASYFTDSYVQGVTCVEILSTVLPPQLHTPMLASSTIRSNFTFIQKTLRSPTLAKNSIGVGFTYIVQTLNTPSLQKNSIGVGYTYILTHLNTPTLASSSVGSSYTSVRPILLNGRLAKTTLGASFTHK